MCKLKTPPGQGSSPSKAPKTPAAPKKEEKTSWGSGGSAASSGGCSVTRGWSGGGCSVTWGGSGGGKFSKYDESTFGNYSPNPWGNPNSRWGDSSSKAASMAAAGPKPDFPKEQQGARRTLFGKPGKKK